MTETESIHSTALALAALGYSVLPLTPPDTTKHDVLVAGKKPLVYEWTTRPALTEREINKAWRKYPDANLGIVCGRASGVICLDVDPRNGGMDWWNEHADSIRATHAPCEFSGRGDGGMHWFFRVPEGHEGRVISAKIAPGIDFLGDGKQVVTTPSIHAVTGQPYYFAEGITLFDRELIPDLPDFLRPYISVHDESRPTVISGERLAKRQCSEAERDSLEVQLMSLDGSAGRHHTLGSWVINAVACGLEHETIIELGDKWLVANGRDPQPDEVKNWINSAIVGLQSGKFQPSLGNASDWGFEVVPEEGSGVAPIVPQSLADASAAAQEASMWVLSLDKSEKGGLKVTRRNAEIILDNDQDLKLLFAVNEMAQGVVVLRPPPWDRKRKVRIDGAPLTDVDVLNFSSYLASKYGIEIGKDKAIDAITVVADRYRFHPVREYLTSLAWDGFPRLDDMLAYYFRAEGDPEYLSFVGSKWMISCVARALNPGCKADCALILEGDQGVLKSTAFSVLGGRWFSDDMGGDIGSRDAIDSLRFSWIIEMPELSRLNRSAVDQYTAFLSRQVDRIRLAYARCTSEMPRGFIFCGTTNQELYLRDETGNRRFWPVSVRHLNPLLNEYINVIELANDRDQLWAEATARFLNGERWYPEGHDIKILNKLRSEQSARYQADQWTESVSQYLRGYNKFDGSYGEPRTRVTGLEIWESCVGGTMRDFDPFNQRRISAILRHQGYRAGQFSRNGVTVSGFIQQTAIVVKNTEASDEAR